MPKDLADLTIAVSAHEFFKGSPQELRDFLLEKKVKKLVYVAHQFSFVKESVSYKEIYENGTLSSKETSAKIKGREFFFYARDFFYNLKFLIFSKDKYDIYIGVDSFNAMFGLLLKFLGRADITVFFTIDYIMKDRFNLAFLSKLYVLMDRLAFFYSDYTWNVSYMMTNQRIKELGAKAETKVQIEVPIGAPVEEAAKINIQKKDNILVYSGHLQPLFGLEFVVENLPALVEAIPNLELRIMGAGGLEQFIRDKVKSFNLEKNVNFLGYINTITDREKWLTYLKECTVGLAIYEPTKDTYKKFSDVTKPKDYMACGMPVITTDVIPLAKDIRSFNLGRVIDYTSESFVNAIKDLMLNQVEKKTVQDNVSKYIVNVTWKNIFTKAFGEMNFQ